MYDRLLEILRQSEEKGILYEVVVEAAYKIVNDDEFKPDVIYAFDEAFKDYE